MKTMDKRSEDQTYEYVTDKQYEVGQVIYDSGEPRVVVKQEATSYIPGVTLYYTTVEK